jgi:hypothetical protein
MFYRRKDEARSNRGFKVPIAFSPKGIFLSGRELKLVLLGDTFYFRKPDPLNQFTMFFPHFIAFHRGRAQDAPELQSASDQKLTARIGRFLVMSPASALT